VSGLNQRIGAISLECAPELPAAKPREREPDYNRRAAEMNERGLVLLDGKMIRFAGERSGMEVCDLLAIDRKFIHVKRGMAANRLSHLFTQGTNSARAFIKSEEFRQCAFEICSTAGHTSHRGIFEGIPAASEHTVVFGIITGKGGDIREILPLFSKGSLRTALDELEGLGFRVCLEKIEISAGEDDSPPGDGT